MARYCHGVMWSNVTEDEYTSMIDDTDINNILLQARVPVQFGLKIHIT
jgi:hypothetical protein